MGGVGPSGGICAHQFDGYTPNSDHYWFDKLNSTDLTTYDPDFYKSFHRWYTMCHVTTAGRYFIQVRASVPFNKGFQEDFTYLTKPEAPPEDLTLGGQNRYSLRIVDPGTNNYSLNSSAYSVARLPVYTNTVAGQNPTFYLARLLPGNNTTGRILNLEFYDIGDVGGTTTLTILPPPDAKGGVPDCSQWIFNGDVNNKAPAGSIFTGCTLTGITTAGYNGVLVNVKVKVPGTYTCDVSSDTGCWFKIFMAYSKGAQANDTTTWGASIGGDPVRLVK
jgi:hypothetical protein